MTKNLILLFGCLCVVGWAGAQASTDATDYPVPLTEGRPYIHVLHEGRSVKIQRIQDPEFELKGYYAKTSRKCPPFCLHPIEVAPGVRTFGEVEVFDFIETKLRDGVGILVDSRTDEWYKKGTIPGALSLPFDRLALEPNDPKWADYFKQFGAKPRAADGLVDKVLASLGLAEENPLKTEKWDFTGAKDLLLFCNGPTCDQSPHAIRSLIAAGFPVSKLFYYRGGMLMWQLWGLTTVLPPGAGAAAP